MNATYSLSKTNRTGTYYYQIDFTPLGNDQVRVKDTMIDEMMGNWNALANAGPRIMSLKKARDYYRDRKQFGGFR